MKNKIIEFLKIIAVSAITSLIWFILPTRTTKETDGVDCDTLIEFYNIDYISDFFQILLILVVIVVTWIVGVLIYYYLRRKRKINIYLYFTVATLISLSTMYFKPKEKKNIVNISPEMKNVICKKGSDDGMFLQLDNLTNNEYEYLRSLKKWWPEIPNEANSINVEYYRDDFLGDFSFDINLDLPNIIEIDSIKYPEWTKIDGKYHFSKSQN
ncbi:hypothetical protein VOI54_12505 [Tamlana sp. 2201CG12-4]|uniref:hypothetical protein n=1 Tax=Tamlana sp. 2201CG12-4 TaxID=3112582 RepID=UPI002DB92C79|nr:hypothetical protein [Tamlana sp. 2201CG12-4]MEC3907842.1 hypothetical protein [Tamlana sp. 2201CG12-4]